MLSLGSTGKSRISFLLRLWMTRTVDINTGQSGALESRGQPSQEPPCCPGSPLPNPECSLPARMGQRQTVPRADGDEQPRRHMHGLQGLLEVLPTQGARGPQRGRGVPVTHRGAGWAGGGQPEDSLLRASRRVLGRDDVSWGLREGAALVLTAPLPHCSVEKCLLNQAHITGL